MSRRTDRRQLAEEVARLRLARRLGLAVATLADPAAPLVVIDADAFDTNAADLLRRASGTPIRLASKSVRVPALIRRALGMAGFAGVLAYTLREALWLCEQDIADDIVLGYPTVDVPALARLLDDDQARSRITLMVDDVAQLDLVAAAGDPAGVRIALDIDAGLRLGPRSLAQHVGPKRSPLLNDDHAVRLARSAIERGFALVGAMTYEGQVAGLPDDVPGRAARSLAIRRIKAASIHQLAERRRRTRTGLEDLADLEFWNAGGSGSIESSAADPAVTEVTAGSGLLVPALFDHYRSFTPRPAAFFGLRVCRRPAPGVVTVAGGGFVASGAAGVDRLPVPWAPPGLRLTALEGAGEVQTPLTGPAVDALEIGDLVWFRHAKSGELPEHTNVVHLLAGDRIVGTVPTYRGCGLAW